MSATLHIEKLTSYFGDIPQVHIGSSRYPVEEFYLEHILKFVGFGSNNFNRENSTNNNNNNKITNILPLKSKKIFTCPICNSSTRVFYSSAELGTHVALCNGKDIFDNNNNDNEKSYTNKKSMNSTPSTPILVPVKSIPIQEENNEYDETEAEVEVEAEIPIFEDDPDETLITEDSMIISEMIGESSFSRAATRFLSHSDDDLIKKYQQAWDDSLVDIDLIYALIKYIFQSEFSRDHGVVLVFLPGWDDISRLRSLLFTDVNFRDYSRFRILPLHSGIIKIIYFFAFVN